MRLSYFWFFLLSSLFIGPTFFAVSTRRSSSPVRSQRTFPRSISRGMQRPVRSSVTRSSYVNRSKSYKMPSKQLSIARGKSSTKQTVSKTNTAVKTTSKKDDSSIKNNSTTQSSTKTVIQTTAAQKSTAKTKTTTTVTTTSGSTTTTVTVTTRAGGGVVVGSSLKHLRHPHHHYWGRRFFYASLGWWYYPWYGWWYFDDWGCWYYPGPRCWFFHRGWCWYYPHYHFSLYLASEPKRIIFVENDEDDDLFYAVYCRYRVGDEYYLYRVNEPEVIVDRKVVKVSLPQKKSREYVVLADRDKAQLSSTVCQKASGVVEKTADVGLRDNEQELREDAADIKVANLNKKDKRTLKKLKKEVDKRKKQLAAAEQKLNNVNAEDLTDNGAGQEQ